MNTFIDFFSFSEANVRYVVLGTIILGASSAIVGGFTFLKKRSLVGDAVAHSVLPGVCLAFFLAGTKNPFFLVIGAFITGWLSLVSIDWIVAKSKIKEDTAIGLVLSVFFGLGIMFLTMIQHSGNAAQSGLEHFLFGKASALVGQDVMVFGIIGLILISTVILFFKEFKLIAFDENFAKVIGFPVRKLELLLTSLTVLAVVIGIQAVGVVLMAAMLITPVAAARYWTNKLALMLVLSAIFGAFSGVMGTFVSYTQSSIPTGPSIVLVASLIAFISFFFAPERGIISKMRQQRQNRLQMLEENILKTFYKLGEEKKEFFQALDKIALHGGHYFAKNELTLGLSRLQKKSWLKKVSQNTWKLTKLGKEKGQKVVKLHRLWELYLTQYLDIASDHVHENAEVMEHILTPEIEKELENRLNHPTKDPHDKDIPY